MVRTPLGAHPRSRGENSSSRSSRRSSTGSSPLTRGKPLDIHSASLSARLIPAHAGKTTAPPSRDADHGAHPRSRGENNSARSDARGVTGSSPLTRGKPISQLPVRRTSRLIPAHAGKTMICFSGFTRTRAHPRSRGENWFADAARGVSEGSSPLTRGKHCVELRVRLVVGLIPAHAGKTMQDPFLFLIRWAHPRSRGENANADRAPVVSSGSFPLTRGKPSRCLPSPSRGRLIPAHAGKTVCACGRRRRGWAHPRSRGENAAEETAVDIHLGSSPLTRGKRATHAPVGFANGLIPAHAGKTDVPLSREEMKRAHPRSRGENVGTMPGAGPLLGSSPLTRGKRRRRLCDATLRGLIPAHAGKTRAWRAPGRRERAHPRSRGENLTGAEDQLVSLGSSPLTRGKRRAQTAIRRPSGLIPAHAGKTTWENRGERIL